MWIYASSIGPLFHLFYVNLCFLNRAFYPLISTLFNKLQPYLHESRHLHAVNRVRGSGGRFLSSKKLQQADPTSISSARGISDTNHFHKKNTTSEFESHSGTMEYVASVTSCSEITSVSNSEFILQQAERGFSAIQSHGRLVCSEMQHCASVARWDNITGRQFILGFFNLLEC